MVSGNHIVDDQGGGATMSYGILEQISGTSPGGDTVGMLTDNIISGAITSDVAVLSKMAVMRRNGMNFSIGKSSSTAPFNVAGDVRAEGTAGSGVNLFVEMCLAPAVSAGGFLLGYGWNIRFDGTNWVTGFDGTSNGAALILLDYGTGKLNFYVIPKTGGTAQTITPGSLGGYLIAQFDPATSKETVSNAIQAFTGLFNTIQNISTDLNIDSSAQIIIAPVSNLNLNPSGNLQINGINGLTLGSSVGALVTSVTTANLQYKDWSGTNQSLTVVTGVALRFSGWTKGILTN
jgi:hypothetical protein